jgi:hypothetical protein
VSILDPISICLPCHFSSTEGSRYGWVLWPSFQCTCCVFLCCVFPCLCLPERVRSPTVWCSTAAGTPMFIDVLKLCVFLTTVSRGESSAFVLICEKLWIVWLLCVIVSRREFRVRMDVGCLATHHHITIVGQRVDFSGGLAQSNPETMDEPQQIVAQV